MRNASIGAAALLLALAAAPGRAAEISWSKSFDAALSSAKTSNKLVMADFYTDW